MKLFFAKTKKKEVVQIKDNNTAKTKTKFKLPDSVPFLPKNLLPSTFTTLPQERVLISILYVSPLFLITFLANGYY